MVLTGPTQEDELSEHDEQEHRASTVPLGERPSFATTSAAAHAQGDALAAAPARI